MQTFRTQHWRTGMQICCNACEHYGLLSRKPGDGQEKHEEIQCSSAKQVNRLYTRDDYKEILESASTKHELDNGIEEIGEEISQLVLYNSDSK